MQIDRYLKTDSGPSPSGPSPSGNPSPKAVFFEKPVWALGFRPFFIAAGLFSALALVLWLAIFLSGFQVPLAFSHPFHWHAHEMVFGFAVAVLAGFLLTAVKNWTSGNLPTGSRLASLVLLWTLGRVVLFFGGALPSFLVVLIDLAFLPAFALAILLPILKAKSRRNLIFPILLFAMAVVNLLFHLSPTFREAAVYVSLDLVACFLIIMGGRVIPLFTKNALKREGKNVDGIYKRPKLDKAITWLTVAFPLIHQAALWPGERALPALASVAAIWALLVGVLNLYRMKTWGGKDSLHSPILWVLHLGFFWVGLGFVLLGLQEWIPALAGTAPLHTLTVGGLGTLTIGMMARVGLGHTGRPLHVTKTVALSFHLMTGSTLLRVLVPLIDQELTRMAYMLSGTFWSLAFAIFVIAYWGILTSPRADGKPG